MLPALPVGFRDDQCFCDGLTLNLMRAVAASGQARVVPWTTSHWLAEKTGDKREHYLRTDAHVILEPLVQQTGAGRCSVTVQWIDGPTGLFDKFYEVHGQTTDALSIVNDLASQLAENLRINYDERTRSRLAVRHSSDPAALIFYLRARRDALTFSPAGVQRSFDLLRQALQRDQYFAAAHALQSELFLGVGDAGAAPPAQFADWHGKRRNGRCALRRNWATVWRRAERLNSHTTGIWREPRRR